MKRKGYAAVAAVALVSLGLTACGGSSSSEGEDKFILANGSEPQNALLPANTNETGGGRIVEAINARLVHYDKDAQPELDLAESITPNEDNQVWTIKIKEGKVFSDGSPINADSFVDAWNFAANLDNAQNNSYFFENIKGFSAEKPVEKLEGLQKIDEQTFKVELNGPTADYKDRLGYTAYSPLPKVALKDPKAYGENPTVTSGPYKLADKGWVHNRSLKIVKNDKYDGPAKAKNAGVEFKIYTQLNAAYNDVLSGKLDVLDQIPPDMQKVYKKDFPETSVNKPIASIQSLTIPSANLAHFDIKTKEGQLRREAISMSINRKEICDTIFAGTRDPAHEYTSPGLGAAYEKINAMLGDATKNTTYNPTEAKKKWAEANKIAPFEGKFEIGYNSDGGHQTWVDAAANQIKNTLGIDALGKPYPDFKSFRDDITKQVINSAYRSGWQADYPGVSNFLEPLYSVNGSSNDGKYNNPEFDKLLKEANASTDANTQTEKYAQAEKILLEQLPDIPLWYYTQTTVWNKDVKDVQVTWNGIISYSEIEKN